jgi:hypothetical protein
MPYYEPASDTTYKMHGVHKTCAIIHAAELCSAAAAALVLGNGKYPRPCSGFSGMDQRKCFCHYHPVGQTYVWPFSRGAKVCRQTIKCMSPGLVFKDCDRGKVADDLEFNGQSLCLPEPPGYNCSTRGKPCISKHP